MASLLAETQITAKQRLQHLIANIVAATWKSLPHYDQAQVDQFLSTVIPLSAAANRQSVLLTQAYLARTLGQLPAGLDADQIIAGIRNGATPEDVYKRPFVTVWTALKAGTPWEKAVQMGQDRATSAAATDVQLSFTHTLRASSGNYGDQIVGYVRVPDSGACDFCQAASGLIYHSDDLMPLHTWCGCGVEPVSAADMDAFPVATDRFAGPGDLEVAVHQHGELGPVLTNAADHFTGPAAVGHAI